MEKILLTGSAGFIGYHLAERLLTEGCLVIGVDNFNDYYDQALKFNRSAQLETNKNFTLYKEDLSNTEAILDIFATEKPSIVINLAAQAGVMYSKENPYSYMESNINGFMSILEGCRHNDVKHLVYASSSSVYGANRSMPFSEHDATAHPLSLYAASKKANEMMAHSYSHMYGLPTTGLRFFTVYGPWGRPDMAMMIFIKAILADEEINVFNNGESIRDFTYVDDIVEGVYRISSKIPTGDAQWDGTSPDPAISKEPYRIYNIGNNNPVKLSYLIEVIEKALGKTAKKVYQELPRGDVEATFANIDDLVNDAGFKPDMPIEDGVQKLVDWYMSYYE
ncbi:MAG: NAD-dependent epimerase [Lentisphaeria bacterium]|nr:NAD-dependent epimerase [Lentisphaeria bacterium]